MSEGQARAGQPICMISVFKSGTWFLRNILGGITGLPWHEPEIVAGEETDYADAALIDLRPDSIFSWHSFPTPEVRAVLAARPVRVVLLVRNIFDLVVSMHRHFAHDIDADQGRSAGAADIFANLSRGQGLAMTISGAESRAWRWVGLGPHLRQIQDMLELSLEQPCHLVSYERLLAAPQREIAELARYLGVQLTPERIAAIAEDSRFEKMKATAGEGAGQSHFQVGRAGGHASVLSAYHVMMVRAQQRTFAPRLAELAARVGMPELLACSVPMDKGLQDATASSGISAQDQQLIGQLHAIQKHMASGEYSKGLVLCDIVLQRKPVNPDLLFIAANLAVKAGKALLAVDYLEQGLRQGSEQARFHAALGVLLGEMGKTDVARRHLERALALEPDNAEARQALHLPPAPPPRPEAQPGEVPEGELNRHAGLEIRKELAQDKHVFFVSSFGYAADHWFGWFPKALNSHPEIFALLAHEGSRPKYLKERTRGERPPIVPFAHFLNDMGMTYQAIGDCYSYKASQFRELLATFGEDIPMLNLVRHPYVCLEFYIRWRATNMRMPDGSSGPIDWEWGTVRHDLFERLELKPYAREDVHIWSAYQGMHLLNMIVDDQVPGVRQMALESVVGSREVFAETVRYLTKGRCEYSPALLDTVFGFVNTPFRGEEKLRMVPHELYATWPDWKKDAFEKLVRPEAIALYERMGYAL